MRSARPLSVCLAGLSLAGLPGCVTTQQRNARAELRAKRLLASRRAVLVRRDAAGVRVDRVELVRSARGTAIVATVANTGARSLADLPITVGVVFRHRRAILNSRGGLDYFDSHVASVAPGARVTWVFTTRRHVARGARPFARVGAPALATISRPPATLPALRVKALAPTSGAVRVRVANLTSVPQYGLPVYALARRAGRVVAGGRATVSDLGTRTAATVGLPLVGPVRGASLQIEALPTIFK